MKLSRRDWAKLSVAAGATLLPGVSQAAAILTPASAADSQTQQKWGIGVDPGQTLPPEAANGPWKNLRAVKAKKVFDVHCHLYSPLSLDPNIKGRISDDGKWQDYTPYLLAAMDAYGVAQAAPNPIHEVYETIVRVDIEPHLDRFVRSAGLQTMATKGKELTPQLVADVYRKQLEQDGCILIGESAGDAWTQMLRGGKYTAKDLKPMADIVMKHDVPVQIHTGWSAGRGRTSYQTAWRWAEDMGSILAEYPGIKFILAHLGGQMDGHEALRLAFSFDNAWVDTSTARVDMVSEVVRGIGAERVMFGSDFNRPELVAYGPFQFRAVYQYWWNLDTIANANLTEDQRDQILYKSARKLLKLPPA